MGSLNNMTSGQYLPLKSFFSESLPSSCFLLSLSFPEDRRLTPAWDSRFFSWLHSRSSSDCTTLGLNLSAYVLETHRETQLKQTCIISEQINSIVCEGALTQYWWRVSAADVWTPPWGQCWAATLQVSAAAGVADPEWSQSHRAATTHWADHWKLPRRRPLADNEHSVQKQSPAGGAAGLLWCRKI